MPYVDSKAIKYGNILFNNFKRGATDMFRVYRENELIWTKFGVPSDENYYVSSWRSGGPYVFQSWNKSGDLIFELDNNSTNYIGYGGAMIIVGDFIYVSSFNEVLKLTKNGTLIWRTLGRSGDPGINDMTYVSSNNTIIVVGSGRTGTSLNTRVTINADTGAIGSSVQISDSIIGASALGSKWVYAKLRVYDTSYTVWYGNTGSTQKSDADWTYDHLNDSYACFLHSSGVYVGGRINNPPAPANFSLVKLDTSGNLVWGVNTNQIVRHVYVDNSSNVYCVGSRTGNITTRKLNSSGTILWSRDHGTEVFTVSVDESNGDVYTSGGVISDISTRKYNSSGTLIWSRRVKTPTTQSSSGVFG